MSNVISKAALMEWLGVQNSRFKTNDYFRVIREIESGTFDIPAVAKRCHLCPDDAETCYCYDAKPSVDADAKEIERTVSWYDSLNVLTDTQKIYVRDVRQLLAKLAEKEAEVERERERKQDAYNNLAGWMEHAHDLDAKLNQAVEALEYYARCRECGGKGYFEIPTGVEHLGIQEIGKEPCECHIAKAALQSIKGGQPK